MSSSEGSKGDSDLLRGLKPGETSSGGSMSFYGSASTKCSIEEDEVIILTRVSFLYFIVSRLTALVEIYVP